MNRSKEPFKKSCHNCQDSIVCYGFDEPEDKVCNDWHLDFMIYQEWLEEKSHKEQDSEE